MGDRRVAHAAFAGGPDRRDAKIRAKSRAHLLFGVGTRLAAELLGRAVTYNELSFEENRDAMIRAGVPAPVAEMNAQAFSLTADGDAEWVTDDVAAILGRPARAFRQFAADYATAFS